MAVKNDEPILKHLQDVTVSLPETNSGFFLNFHFGPNEFFSNTVLTKEYILKNDYNKEDLLEFDGPELIAARGCSIDWKPGKNPGVRIIQKKKKVIKEKRDTFFDFFTPPNVNIDEMRDHYDDETNRAITRLNEHFDIGMKIKEKLIPKAVLYFTGEADDIDTDEDFDEEDSSDEEDEWEDFEED